MISRPVENINELVDFDRLRDANGLLMKWSKHFKMLKTNHVHFCIMMWQNPKEFEQKLPAKRRKTFAKDCQTMFYAKEIEEILVKQFHPMVFKLMKRLKIPFHLFDHFEVEGMIAVRNSVWNYRWHDILCSFSTFCYNSAFMRLRSHYHKMQGKNIQREKRALIRNETEFDVNFDFRTCPKEYINDAEYDLNAQIQGIIERCQLDEKEAMLLRCFAFREEGSVTWQSEYRKKYKNNKMGGKPLSRQSVYNHLEMVQTKIFKQLLREEQVSIKQLDSLTYFYKNR
jgi:hypothetical protein